MAAAKPFPFPPPFPTPIARAMIPITHPWRTELGATLRLAGPLAVANLLQMMVYAIDVVFVARLGQRPWRRPACRSACSG